MPFELILCHVTCIPATLKSEASYLVKVITEVVFYRQ